MNEAETKRLAVPHILPSGAPPLAFDVHEAVRCGDGFGDDGVSYRSIDGFPDYRVGDDGSVWSKNQHPWKSLALHPDRHGYLRIKLCKNGRYKNVKVHLLVAAAFIGKRPGRLEVCHNNGNRNDCRVSNLRYDTHVGNHADRRAHGTSNAGEKNGSSALTEEQARAIKIRVLRGENKTALMAEFGVGRRCVERIARGERWGHLDVTHALEIARPA